MIVSNRRYEAMIGFARHFGLVRTVGTSLAESTSSASPRRKGCRAVRVEHADALDGALSESLASPAPSLVEIAVA